MIFAVYADHVFLLEDISYCHLSVGNANGQHKARRLFAVALNVVVKRFLHFRLLLQTISLVQNREEFLLES